MKQPQHLNSNQSGLAHLALIALFVLVLGGIGFAGYSVYQKNQDKETAAVSNDNDEQSGEILPPADDEPEEPADVTEDDLTEPTE